MTLHFIRLSRQLSVSSPRQLLQPFSHDRPRSANMLRRLSSKFGGKKKEDSQNKGSLSGGTNGNVNGLVNGDRKPTSLAVQKPDAPDHSVTAGDVQSNFEKFAQLLHASHRPLPAQSTDGASLEESQPSGFMQDLKTFGFKDLNTMMQVMKGKATGELQEYVYFLLHRLRRTSAKSQVPRAFPYCQLQPILHP